MARSPFEALVKDGVLTKGRLAEATKAAQVRGRSVGWTLIHELGLSPDAVGKALAAHYKVEFVPLREGMKVLRNAHEKLSTESCVLHQVAPLAREKGKLVLLMADPSDLPRKDELRALLKEPFVVKVALPEDIQQLLAGSAPSLESLLTAEPEEERVPAIEVHDAPVVSLLDATLLKLVQGKARQLRIDPRCSPVVALDRAKGWEEIRVPAAMQQPLVRRLKVMANLDLGSRAKAQKGTFVMLHSKGRSAFGVSIDPVGGGEEAAVVTPV